MAGERRASGLGVQGSVLLIVLLLGVQALVFARLIGTTRETIEATECAQQQQRLSVPARDLGKRLEAAQDLVQELGASEPVTELLESLSGDGPPPLAEFARLDRYLTELGGRDRTRLRLTVSLAGETRPMAGWSRRPWARPGAMEDPAPRAARPASPGRVEFQLAGGAPGPPELEAALLVRRGRVEARLVVALEVAEQLETLARLARVTGEESWVLLDESGRMLQAEGPEADALAAFDLREEATTAVAGTLTSLHRIGPPAWRFVARVPSSVAAKLVKELIGTLILAAGAMAIVLVLGLGRARAGFLQASLGEKERQEAFLRGVFDAITDPLVVLDRDLVIVRANRVAEERWGRIVGRAYAEVLAPRSDDMARDLLGLREVFERARPRRVEVKSATGRETWELAQFPILGGDQVASVVEYAVDVTQERLLRQQLVQSEKLSTLGEMAAGIAHEINNPLGVISMYAQLLQEEVRESLGAEAGALEKVKTIEDQATHVGSVVTNLLRFARKSEGAKARIDARAAVERALAIFAHQKSAREVEVVKELGEEPAWVLGDEAQLAQVLLNLAVNASHAMKGTGRLTLRARRKGPDDPPPPGRAFGDPPAAKERVLLQVSDSGHGIPPETLERIFEPFFTTKPVGEGTGLGLSVSFAIVRDHGGCVWVESVPGKGATFTLDLPLAPIESAET